MNSILSELGHVHQKSKCPRSSEYVRQPVPLAMWSSTSDEVTIRGDTMEALKVVSADVDNSGRRMLVGIITSDSKRVVGLLDDLGAMLDNRKHSVIVFANQGEDLADRISKMLQVHCFKHHIIRSADRIVRELFPDSGSVLPIAKSRTVLQTFMYAVTKVEEFDAVAVLDDDMRLPKGWGVCDGEANTGDIFLGRAIKTPPNPTVMSMRTQLLDFIHALDLHHSDCGELYNELTFPVLRNLDDQYYDLSSTRWDHLEMPRLFSVDLNDVKFVEKCRHRILVGDPLAREAISTETGESGQRGGCMVLFRKNFDLLGTEQVAPIVKLSSNRYSSSRRSDSFWVQRHRHVSSKKSVVLRSLSIVHVNTHDVVPDQERMRETAALEMIGAFLCRPEGNRSAFVQSRLGVLQSSVARIRGLCKSLRKRWYFSIVPDLREFVLFLEELYDADAWDTQVFTVVKNHLKELKSWNPNNVPERSEVKSFELSYGERMALFSHASDSAYPDVSKFHSGPVIPVPCLHRIHGDEPLQGAQVIQERIGMSLNLFDVQVRLRKLAELVEVVRQFGPDSDRKALVTMDDGFCDALMLKPIFRELSGMLQPVVFIPSSILRHDGKSIRRRHLPLTCLYDYCSRNNVEPEDKDKLGGARRSLLKLLPEKEQYSCLEKAGVPTFLDTSDLLTIDNLKELSEEGWWICSHGPDHCNLTTAISVTDVVIGLKADFATIRHYGWTPWFAWPEGCWNTRIVDELIQQDCGASIQFGLSPPKGESQHSAIVNRTAWFGGNHKHKVLVTGSSGFLGQHLVLVLNGYGFDVSTYDLVDGHNILDRKSLLDTLKEGSIKTCVHLAAVADLNEAEENPDNAHTVNVKGTRIVLSCCDEVGVRLLFASTCCVYGNNGVCGSNDESSPPAPTEIYADTKLASEIDVLESNRLFDLKHVVMRLATFYGPGMRAALATSLF